jgi:sugar phosphate isomerase/epimerase
MFTSESAAERKKADDDNLRAIDEAHELGSELLAIVCGPTVNKDLSGSRAMVRDGLEKILNHAQGAGVHLGIEPLHPMLAADRSVVTSLRDANALRLEIDHPNLGIVVDSYNVWFDPELEDLLTAIGPGLLGFQLADWILPITDPTANRGMIGDGYIDFGRVIAAMDAAGYRGLIEVEILSHQWRRQPAGDVVRLVADRFTALAETKTTTSETHARRHLTG